MSFKFPWGAKETAANKDEVSLDDILPTAASKTELVLLVVLCTDRMLDMLTQTFEPPDIASEQPSSSDLLLVDVDDASDQQKATNYYRQMDLASPEIQGLKRSSVTFFNAWRTAALRRVGESLNVRPDAVKQAKASYVSNADAEAQARKDSDFFAWAEGRDEDVSGTPNNHTTAYLDCQFELISTPLAKFDEKNRALILNSCLFMLLSLESYPAQSRVLILYLCHCLRLPVDVVRSAESTLAITLLKSASSEEIDTDQARKDKANQDATARKWKVGLATVGGAVLVGVTGGLAAPLLMGVAGSIMGGIGLGGLASLLGATIANPVTIAALFGTLGGHMSGKAMEQFAKEVRDFRLIRVQKQNRQSSPDSSGSSTSPSPEIQKLRVAIGISGWVLDQSDVTQPWQVLSADTLEVFALQYERDALIDLAATLDKVLRGSAFTLAQAGAIQLALPAIAAAMLPVSLLKSGQFLDNPFSIALERSDKAGKVLAAALMSKAQGERPVTLIGFSMGSRVVYSCLRELALQQAFGLIDDVVMIGSPVPSDESAWRRMRSVVAGRLINVYTTRDLLLGVLYRTRNIQLNVAGLQAITGVPGIENKDVSDFVKGHNQYRLAIGRILKEIGMVELDANALAHGEMELEEENQMEQKVYQQAKAEGRLDEQEDASGRIIMVDSTQVDTSGDRSPHDNQDVESLDSDAHSIKLGKLQLKEDNPAPLFHRHEADRDSDTADDDEYESNDGDKPMTQLEPEPEHH